MNIDQQVREWLESSNIKDSTRKLYRRVIGFWFRWLSANKRNVAYPTRADVIGYKDHLFSLDLSSFTVSCYLSAVRSFYKYIREAKVWDQEIASHLRLNIHYEHHMRDSLTDDDVQKLLSFDRTTPDGMRDYLMIRLMLTYGFRRLEIYNINDDDIRFERGSWVLSLQRKGKPRKEPFTNLEMEEINLIREYQAMRCKSDCKSLFQDHTHRDKTLKLETISTIINKRMVAAGIKTDKITTHSLRHTAAINALRNGASLYEVQMMLGHTNPLSTQIYLKTIEKHKYMENPGALRSRQKFLQIDLIAKEQAIMDKVVEV